VERRRAACRGGWIRLSHCSAASRRERQARLLARLGVDTVFASPLGRVRGNRPITEVGLRRLAGCRTGRGNSMYGDRCMMLR
jgi:hypothetical protein